MLNNGSMCLRKRSGNREVGRIDASDLMINHVGWR